MRRIEITDNLLKKYGDWGHAANAIQDRAEAKLSEKEFTQFLIRYNKDNEMSEGQDFIYFNGNVFDWREFQTQAKEIIIAFLAYFTDAQLEKMYPEGGKY